MKYSTKPFYVDAFQWTRGMVTPIVKIDENGGAYISATMGILDANGDLVQQEVRTSVSAGDFIVSAGDGYFVMDAGSFSNIYVQADEVAIRREKLEEACRVFLDSHEIVDADAAQHFSQKSGAFLKSVGDLIGFYKKPDDVSDDAAAPDETSDDAPPAEPAKDPQEGA